MLKSVKSHGCVSLKRPLSCFRYELIDTTQHSSLTQGSRFGYPGTSEMEEATNEKEATKQETSTKAFGESVGL